jgi:Holliday junction resolvase RusA-like endonuclease
VKRAHEPDLDNLPAVIFDALQGLKVKGLRGVRVAAVLKDDRQIRELNSKKIVEGDDVYHGEPRTEITLRRCGWACAGKA